MNAKDLRTIKRRLPLWESAITVADQNDFPELKKKIDEGRKILKMPPFDYSDIYFKGSNGRAVIESKQTRVSSGLRKKMESEAVKKPKTPKEKTIKEKRKEVEVIKGLRDKPKKQYLYTPQEVADMKNKMKMSDLEIANKMKMGVKGFNNYKKEHFKETYIMREDAPLTIRRYCEIKTDTVIEDTKIMKLFGIKSRETITKLKMKVRVEYRIKESINIFSKEYEEAKKLRDLYNKNGLNGKEIGDYLGLSEAMVSRYKNRYLKTVYLPIEINKFSPEIYCHLKNDLNLTDKEIMQRYKLTCKNLIARLKNKYLENYFEVLDKS